MCLRLTADLETVIRTGGFAAIRHIIRELQPIWPEIQVIVTTPLQANDPILMIGY